jgi:hypothetical protein
MRTAGAALLLALALGSRGATQAPAIVLTYRAASEDDASSGRVRLELAASRAARAVVWERACALASRRDADAPDVDADQFWTFRIELTKDARGRAAARVRYRVVTESGPGPEQDRTILLDGKASVAIDAFSARTDCRYDRIQLAVSGG